MNILAIALGGAIGATLRYLLTNLLKHSPLVTNLASPYAATPIVNALGCFIFAFLLNKYHNPPINSALEFFIFTGILASFTTFSTFCFEIFDIYNKFGSLYSFYYMSISLFTSILFFGLGLTLNMSS